MSKTGRLLEIIDFAEKHDMVNYVINDDFTVDVFNENVFINDRHITKFPFQFGKVSGDFSCTGCTNLTSLEGSPKGVEGSFYCLECASLTSLQGAPDFVRDTFNCSYCSNLRSLEGAPKYINGDFAFQQCPNLKSLKGLKYVRGRVYGDFFKGYLKDYKGEL